MIKVSIIGSGNVAQHLILAFLQAKDIEICQVFARNPESIVSLINPKKIISEIDKLLKVDLLLIAVSDNAIKQISSQIPIANQLVAHTSGSFLINDLDSKNRKAVFYPLQTFSKNKEINFLEIPICLEAQNEQDYQILEKVAKSISNNVQKINSNQRKALHVSAVFVCNFTNYLYKIANDICKENNLDFDILKPLILETANKIVALSPDEAQTGPAKREDSITINEHLNFLKNANQTQIYKLLTKSIIDNGKKL